MGLIWPGSHPPNEICVLPIAGLVMNSPHQHVWKGSLLNYWSYSFLKNFILCLIHLHYTKLNNYLFLCAQSMHFLPMSHCVPFFFPTSNWVIFYKNPRQSSPGEKPQRIFEDLQGSLKICKDLQKIFEDEDLSRILKGSLKDL